MKNIVIIGAGDLGREVVWLIEDINKIKPTYLALGFLDDYKYKDGGEFYGYKVIGDIGALEKIAKETPVSAVIAIQDGDARRRIVEEHPDFDSWETIIHPTAVIASTSPVGKGSVIFPHVTVSVNTKIDDFVLLYIHAVICNDCNISKYVSVMFGTMIGERVDVGKACNLGAGCIIGPHLKLEDNKNVDFGTTLK